MVKAGVTGWAYLSVRWVEKTGIAFVMYGFTHVASSGCVSVCRACIAHPGISCLGNSSTFSYAREGKIALPSSVRETVSLTVGIKLNLVMRTGPQICHGNIWPSGALGGLIVIQQQLEAARQERSHTPRGVILMWALGPWDQNNCICMVVSGCSRLSGILGGIRKLPHHFCCSLASERREQVLRRLRPATYIYIFYSFRCHKHPSHPPSHVCLCCVSLYRSFSRERPLFVWFLLCFVGISLCLALDRPTVTVVLFIDWQNNYGLHLFPPKMK